MYIQPPGYWLGCFVLWGVLWK